VEKKGERNLEPRGGRRSLPEKREKGSLMAERGRSYPIEYKIEGCRGGSRDGEVWLKLRVHYRSVSTLWMRSGSYPEAASQLGTHGDVQKGEGTRDAASKI